MKNELEIFLEQFDKLTLDSRQILKIQFLLLTLVRNLMEETLLSRQLIMA